MTSFSYAEPNLEKNAHPADGIISSTSTLGKSQEQLWQDLSDFYRDNEQVIERSRSLEATSAAKDDKATELDITIDSFIDTVNVVLEGLVVLGNVHPVLGVAIFAFHSVIRLDLARRDNNRKVLSVKLQMQNMMCTLFQLRDLNHAHVREAEREQQRARLQGLIKAIAEDIKKCGSDLNYYMDRKFVSKLINAKGYERQFADHIQKFVQRRSELQSTITAYIAGSVDAANIAIGEVDKKIDVIDQKLDMAIMALFRKLDTPREREIVKFIDQNGGTRECITKDELLTKLLLKTGETSEGGKSTTLRGEELIGFRQSLTKELNENLSDVLANNLSRFDKLLAVQNNNLQRISTQIQEQGHTMVEHNMKLDQLTILVLETGERTEKAIIGNINNEKVKLKDPELQRIWDQMGLKRSVKAKNFVLTFRDHVLTDRSRMGTPYPQPLNLAPESPLLLSSTPRLVSENIHQNQLKPDNESDLWVFDFIDVAHVQPVVEAMDEDGSGFISVKEANKFALARPKGVSLLNWIAYWAAGWHINITNYRNKIYSIMLRMQELLPSVHLANRGFVTKYLNNWSVIRIEGLLRSTKPLPDDARKEPRLTDISDTIAELQERSLLTNLKEMSFLVESGADAILVAGSGRVETWILPLIYLLLSRHLKIIKLAQTHVLSEGELSAHSTSFEYVFSVFDDRMRTLEGIFRQIYRDVEGQFAIHAYGMFLTSFKETAYNLSQNTILAFRDSNAAHIEHDEAWGDEKEKEQSDLTSILSQGLGPAWESETFDLDCPAPSSERRAHPIEGAWIGACIRKDTEIAYRGAFEANIGLVVDNKIIGRGEHYLGRLDFEGKILPSAALEESSNSSGLLGVLFKIVSPVYLDIWCKGHYDAEKEIIKGEWIVDSSETSIGFPPDEETQNELRRGSFLLTRTAPDIFRFRYILDGPENPSWNLARKRWAFATEAVLFQTRRRIYPAKFMKLQMAERRTWIEHACRDEQDDTAFLFRAGRLLPLTGRIPPINARIYHSIALYLSKRQSFYLGGVSCDVCGQSITLSRFLCTACIEEDFSNWIDFCAECVDTSAAFKAESKFVHHISHSLIRSSVPILFSEMASMVSQARLRSDRIKLSFKTADAKKIGVKERDTKFKTSGNTEADSVIKSRPSLTQLICACCNTELTLPCWACVTCAIDILICMECERKGEPFPTTSPYDAHTRSHPLLRIHDSSEIKSSELEANRLERRLEGLEDRITTQLEAIQAEVAKHLEKGSSDVTSQEADETKNRNQSRTAIRPAELDSELEERLNRLEKKVDHQFERMASLIQAVLSAIPNGLQKVSDL